jgi:hypothetical protein
LYKKQYAYHPTVPFLYTLSKCFKPDPPKTIKGDEKRVQLYII